MNMKDRIYECWLDGFSIYKTFDVLRLEGYANADVSNIRSYYEEWLNDDNEEGYRPE